MKDFDMEESPEKKQEKSKNQEELVAHILVDFKKDIYKDKADPF